MSFFSELKRRNVFKMAAAYALLGWLVIEMASTILPTFDAPRWVVQTITFLVLLGFPIALFLAWAFELTPEGIRTEASAHTPETISKAKGQRLNYLIFSLIGLALGFLFVDRFVLEGASPRSMAVPQGLQWVSLVLPANRPVSITGNPTRALALSPDGTQIVYTGTNMDLPADNPGGRGQLQLRTLAARTVRDLPGTRGARQPFFSPDGQWVAFFTGQGELKKIALAGGNPVTLVTGINGSSWAFGVWTVAGDIIFGTIGYSLHQVSAEGGVLIELTSLDASQDETAHHVATTLVPPGRVVLFTVRTTRDSSIEALLLDTGKRQLVLEHAYNPHLLSTGQLLFQRDANLLLAPFDTEKLQLAGPAVPVTEAVRGDHAGVLSLAELAVAANGTLAYLPAIDTVRELGLVNRDGSFSALDLPPASYDNPRMAPDGHTLAYTVKAGQDSEIHGFDLQRGSSTRLTLDDEYVRSMEWHPDGRSRALTDARSGYYLHKPDDSRMLMVSQPEGSLLRNGSWSPDGTQLAYTLQTGSLHDIWVVTLGDTPTAEPWLASADEEYGPAFSPDGRWLAYSSNESGRHEIYLRRYPAGERLVVSTEGGQGAVWSVDGSELYFGGIADGETKMQAVTVQVAGDSLQLSRPVSLFSMTVPGPAGIVLQYGGAGNAWRDYDVLPDGRFVMIRNTFSSADNREIVLVQNWLEEVNRLAPVAK